ncbi:MAG: alpha/beta hydrolase [Actinomycetia bacterium]|nr:alpha/beta hydrolase [Actinomycetes bacterium]MCP4222841.1 alpha/beta hydrolase [Actinomycetes bacterium]MCP5031472.1 alpha/beta hydrolase [Actinomycetes bacterium]
MPAVFVHGNPETAAIWGPLLAELGRDDVVALSPPGFGAPARDGWEATRADYVTWLVTELESIDGPIDLVGHDWGGGHVMEVAMQRPDLLRSWSIDVAGIFHPDYVWHDMAQLWQAPDVGEATVKAMIEGPLAERIANYENLGMPTDVATELASAIDETMGRCILALYRDAAQPALSEAAANLPAAAARPGLVVVATEDHYVGNEAMARASAEAAGATVSVLEGVGHWWMLQDPATGAATLEAFWSRVGA